MKHRTTADLVARLMTSMHAGPRLRKQLLIDLGLSPSRTDLIKPHMRALIDSGWVRIVAWQDQWPLYGMQAAPFALPDEPRPVKPAKPAAEPKHRRPAVVSMSGAASVFEWGRS